MKMIMKTVSYYELNRDHLCESNEEISPKKENNV